VLILSIFGIIIFFTSEIAMNLFTNNTNVKKYGSDYLKISALMFPAFPLFFIGNATFQGLKRAIIVMYMAMLRFVIMPLIIIGSLVCFFKVFSLEILFFSLFFASLRILSNFD